MRTIVTDIEGTTSSIRFVREVLFPYSARRLPAFVREHGRDAEVAPWLDAVATEIGGEPGTDAIIEALLSWIASDRKHTALKALQGLIWRDGYRSGEFAAPIYPDALSTLRRWHGEGRRLAVYSSGSVEAQKLFFGHSQAGDLQPLFEGWFDTEVGGKRERASFEAIATRLGVSTSETLFLSDVVEELDAARDAGLVTVLVDRREDHPAPRLGADAGGHLRVESFEAIAPDRDPSM